MIPAKTSTDETGHVGRRIGPYTATSIVVANMIGAGIFTTSGIVAAQVPGAGWVIVCYLLGGMIALSGALCYAELATRMPEEGGEYVYLKKLYHPALGFLTGWTSFLAGFSAPIAASALGFAEYISPGFNRHLPGMSSTGVTIEKKAIAAAIILLFTMVHYVGIRLGSIVQNTLTAIPRSDLRFYSWTLGWDCFFARHGRRHGQGGLRFRDDACDVRLQRVERERLHRRRIEKPAAHIAFVVAGRNRDRDFSLSCR
jgi:hypothetical protein